MEQNNIALYSTVSIKNDQEKPRMGIVVWLSSCGRFARVKKLIGTHKSSTIINEYRIIDLRLLPDDHFLTDVLGVPPKLTDKTA